MGKGVQGTSELDGAASDFERRLSTLANFICTSSVRGGMQGLSPRVGTIRNTRLPHQTLVPLAESKVADRRPGID
jgi:hypothetical protein